MDLFTKRCGCGAIYRPAVATSRACATCEARVYSERRQAAVVARSSEIRPPSPAKQIPLGRPMDPCAKGVAAKPEPVAPPGWEWPQLEVPPVVGNYAADLPLVNGKLIPPGTKYSVADLRPRWAPQTQYDVVVGSEGRAFRTKRQSFQPDAGTVQAIIETVDEAVRNRIDPRSFARLARSTCDQIVAIVEQELERCLPVTVCGKVVEYGPEQGGRYYEDGFRVRARLFTSTSSSYDLTWTFR